MSEATKAANAANHWTQSGNQANGGTQTMLKPWNGFSGTHVIGVIIYLLGMVSIDNDCSSDQHSPGAEFECGRGHLKSCGPERFVRFGRTS